jgi:hypothetical protein
MGWGIFIILRSREFLVGRWWGRDTVTKIRKDVDGEF